MKTNFDTYGVKTPLRITVNIVKILKPSFLGVWRVSGGCFEHVWKVFGGYLKSVWRLLRKCLEGIWKVLGRCLEDVWNVSEWCLLSAKRESGG